MVYKTHLYLGTLLYPVIREAWNLPLSRKRFLRGCVKPDMTSLFIRHPHFWRMSKKFFFKKVKKVSGMEIRKGRKNKKFSEDLGVILHYAADFFTSVHNIEPNDIAAHLAFERALHEDFLRLCTEDSLRDGLAALRKSRIDSGRGWTEKELKATIVRRHRENRSEPKSTDYDIGEIIAACLIVTDAVMELATGNIAGGSLTGMQFQLSATA
jgi:hypothetical protein